MSDHCAWTRPDILWKLYLRPPTENTLIAWSFPIEGPGHAFPGLLCLAPAQAHTPRSLFPPMRREQKVAALVDTRDKRALFSSVQVVLDSSSSSPWFGPTSAASSFPSRHSSTLRIWGRSHRVFLSHCLDSIHLLLFVVDKVIGLNNNCASCMWTVLLPCYYRKCT